MAMNDSATGQRKIFRQRRQRIWLILIGIVLAGIGLTVGAYYYSAHEAEKRLAAAIAATDLLDPYWRFEDLETHREIVPDDSNGALVASAAAQLMPAGWLNFNAKPLLQDREPHTACQLNLEQANVLRAKLKEAAAAVSKARLLKDLPKGRYAVAWSEDAISTLLPHLQKTRELANLLSYDAMLRAHDKDLDGALESCQAMLNLSRSIGDEPTYISALVRIAIRAVALGRLEQVLSQGQASEAALAALQQASQEEEKFPLLLAASRGERAFGDRLLVFLQKGRPKNMVAMLGGPNSGMIQTGNATLDRLIASVRMGSIPTNRAALLELHNEIIAAVQLPEMERKQHFDDLRARRERLPGLAQLLFPTAEKLAEAIRRSDALMRSTIAALAAERYRLANGRWPESLSGLVPAYLKEVPRDPYDGAPLRLRRLADGLVIYSVGVDGKDNGGTLGVTVGTDTGFRLWDVEHRRQPAPPVKPEENQEPK
jgi:hypothetical protein